MSNAVTRSRWNRWRLVLLGVAIAVIVALPFMLIRAGAERSLDAANLVNHTRQVAASVHAPPALIRQVLGSAAHGAPSGSTG